MTTLSSPHKKAGPMIVKIAAGMWTFLGIVSVIGALLVGPEVSWIAAGFFALFGGVFLYIGIQTLRSRMKDTLASGVVSIIIGLATIREIPVTSLMSFLEAVPAILFITAGVLALLGSSSYRAARLAGLGDGQVQAGAQAEGPASGGPAA